jgi:hypothetical protein
VYPCAKRSVATSARESVTIASTLLGISAGEGKATGHRGDSDSIGPGEGPKTDKSRGDL